ncbi:Protein hob1 [Madurella mycetomatis]|uniref:Protein hob1 n=1 Tax=Madurella mycetomatis TaxID=100816 RepID=A0A175W318_9PEZI|nr:Protein hob1 [Madurella mycetomatis]
MQSMQRQFGKLWNRGPGDNARVSVLLSDYEDADKVLAQIIDNAKLWRDSWASLVGAQLQVVTEYESLYDPIVGASDGHGRPAVPTPQLQLERTFRLKKAYSELKAELLEEIVMIEERIVKPAVDARDCIAPIRKTIKKRENKRLDYEKAQEKTAKLQRKPGRTPKEDMALAKAEAEMARAADEFGVADDHLRHTLPPIVAASFSLVPPLLGNLILIQNRLLGLYYTTLHEYCLEFGFPSPPPPMEEVIAIWNAAASPARSEIETISFIARGKGVRQPSTSTPAPNGFRRAATGLIPGTKPSPQTRALRAPAPSTSLQPPSPGEDRPRQPSPASSTRSRPDYANPTDFTTATILGGAAVRRTATEPVLPNHLTHPSPSAHQRDYFSPRDSQASNIGSSTTGAGASVAQLANGFGASIAAKKKPPPPPPKRIPSTKPEEWVVAQYAFDGQGQGDLSFREGDRIRIITKTETDQDWWVGELGGVKGNFPANYCRAL